MLFRIILLLLGFRMMWLSRYNKSFQKLVEGKDLVLQFRTRSGDVARHYKIVNSKVYPEPGVHPKPNIIFNFKSARFAAKTIIAAGKRPAIFMEAALRHDIWTEGDINLMGWFTKVGDLVAPPPKKK